MMSLKKFYFLFYLFIGHVACGTLVPESGIKPMPPPLRAQSLNHWTSSEVPENFYFLNWRRIALQCCASFCCMT